MGGWLDTLHLSELARGCQKVGFLGAEGMHVMCFRWRSLSWPPHFPFDKNFDVVGGAWGGGGFIWEVESCPVAMELTPCPKAPNKVRSRTPPPPFTFLCKLFKC